MNHCLSIANNYTEWIIDWASQTAIPNESLNEHGKQLYRMNHWMSMANSYTEWIIEWAWQTVIPNESLNWASQTVIPNESLTEHRKQLYRMNHWLSMANSYSEWIIDWAWQTVIANESLTEHGKQLYRMNHWLSMANSYTEWIIDWAWQTVIPSESLNEHGKQLYRMNHWIEHGKQSYRMNQCLSMANSYTEWIIEWAWQTVIPNEPLPEHRKQLYRMNHWLSMANSYTWEHVLGNIVYIVIEITQQSINDHSNTRSAFNKEMLSFVIQTRQCCLTDFKLQLSNFQRLWSEQHNHNVQCAV